MHGDQPRSEPVNIACHLLALFDGQITRGRFGKKSSVRLNRFGVALEMHRTVADVHQDEVRWNKCIRRPEFSIRIFKPQPGWIVSVCDTSFNVLLSLGLHSAIICKYTWG